MEADLRSYRVLTWLAGGTLLLITFCLPETSWRTILYRRTMRLRRLTGNQELKCQAMKAAEQQTSSDMVQEYLVRPIVLCKEPTILIYNIYLALIYGQSSCRLHIEEGEWQKQQEG